MGNMNAPQHTPGPWMVSEGGYRVGTPKEKGRNVAYIYSHDDDAHNGNARLIAAAPVMYEALKRLEHWASVIAGGETPSDHEWKNFEQAIDGSRTALKASRGDA